MSEASIDEEKGPQFPPDAAIPANSPYSHLLRRQNDGSGSRSPSVVSRRRKNKNWDDNGPGGPIAQSAIFPQRQPSTLMSPTEPYEQDDSPSQDNTESTLAADDSSKEKNSDKIEQAGESPAGSSGQKTPPKPVNIYEEGHEMVFENRQGEVLDVEPAPDSHKQDADHVPITAVKPGHDKLWTMAGFKKRVGDVYNFEMEKRKEKGQDRRHEPARAYQFGNTVSRASEIFAEYSVLTTHRLLLKTRMVKLLRPMSCLRPRARAPKLVLAHLMRDRLLNAPGPTLEVYSEATQMSRLGRSPLRRLKLLTTRLFASRLVVLVSA